MNAWIDLLGWTLLHFLWQGAAIAGVFAVVNRAPRSRSPHARYLLGCACLLIMAVAPIVTTWWLYEPAASTVVFMPLAESPEPLPGAIAMDAATPVPFSSAPPALTMSWSERIEAALPWLVLVWGVGAAMLGVRLIGGWCWLQRMRWRGTIAIDDATRGRLDALMRRMRMTRPVRLVSSSLARTPCVLGWWRPIILMPAAMMNDLSAWQLDAILAHELAHVRRHDYLVNLLQTLLETLLFYHPAVWWISAHVRREREHCCDDLAAALCDDRSRYARALLHVAESQSSLLVPAATGSDLARRIRRLVGIPEPQRHAARWSAAGGAAIALALTLIVALATTLQGVEPTDSETTADEVEVAPGETNEGSAAVIRARYEQEANRLRTVLQNGEVSATDAGADGLLDAMNKESEELYDQRRDLSRALTQVDHKMGIAGDEPNAFSAQTRAELQARRDSLLEEMELVNSRLLTLGELIVQARRNPSVSKGDSAERRLRSIEHLLSLPSDQLLASDDQRKQMEGSLDQHLLLQRQNRERLTRQLPDGDQDAAYRDLFVQLNALNRQLRAVETAIKNQEADVPTNDAALQALHNMSAELLRQIEKTQAQLIDVGQHNTRIRLIDSEIAKLEQHRRIAARPVAVPSVRNIEIPFQKLIDGDMQYNIVIRSGDVIRVPAQHAGFVYISGEIERPGAYNVPGESELTLMQLIASAGGLDDAQINSCYVEIRRRLGKQEEVMRGYTLRDVFDKRVDTILIQPSDEVFISAELPADVIKSQRLKTSIKEIEQSIASITALDTPDLSAESREEVAAALKLNLQDLTGKRQALMAAPPLTPSVLDTLQTSPVRPEDLLPDKAEYRISPGDVVQISVFGLIQKDEKAIQQRRINDDGTIRLQLIGEIDAAGMTPSQLEKTVADRLREAKILDDPSVEVIMLQSSQRTFTVLGEPQEGGRNVGAYAIPRPDFRLTEAIALIRGVPGRTQRLIIVRQEPAAE